MGSPTPTAICSAKTNAAILLASSAFVRANSSAWTLADTTPVTSSGRSGHLRGPFSSRSLRHPTSVECNKKTGYERTEQKIILKCQRHLREEECSHSTLERKKTLR